jgi:hypothetical protein
VGFDVLTTCQPSTVWCSRERLPAAAAQPAKVRQSCSATGFIYLFLWREHSKEGVNERKKNNNNNNNNIEISNSHGVEHGNVCLLECRTKLL